VVILNPSIQMPTVPRTGRDRFLANPIPSIMHLSTCHLMLQSRTDSIVNSRQTDLRLRLPNYNFLRIMIPNHVHHVCLFDHNQRLYYVTSINWKLIFMYFSVISFPSGPKILPSILVSNNFNLNFSLTLTDRTIQNQTVTLWSRALLEKLTLDRLVRCFLSIETEDLLLRSQSSQHWTPSWATWVQPTPSHIQFLWDQY
jgi:hypothetical protein